MSDSADAFRRSLSETSAAERAEVERKTDERLAAISARVGEEASRARERAFAAMEKEASEEIALIRAEAQTAERTALLEMKRRLMEEVYSAAAERLEAFPDGERYLAAISKLAAEAASVLTGAADPRTEGAAGDLFVNAADREPVRAALSRALLAGRVELPVPADKREWPRGSVLAVSRDGRSSADNGFLARLERSREFLFPELSAMLFPEGSS